MSEPLVQMEAVGKKYCRNLRRSLMYGVADMAGELVARKGDRAALRKDEFWATQDVSFELRRGETLGLVGGNGAGKSTMLKLIAGLVKPDRGTVTTRGRVAPLIELGAGFSPVLTGRENIYISGAMYGLSRGEVDELFDAIVAFSGIERAIDAPLQSYSSGMKVRLGFAVAAHLRPDVLLVDEVLAVGDASFRRKCIRHMRGLIDAGDTTVILVSHNLRHIEQTCARSLYMRDGQVVLDAPTDEVITEYMAHENAQLADQEEREAVREGSGEVRFTAAELDSARVEPGEPITIRCRYAVNTPQPFLRFRVGIIDIATQAMLTIANVDAHDLDGEGTITCTFDPIHLLPRTYGIYLSITDLLLLVDRWAPAATFVVAGGRDDANKYSVGDGEFMRLPHAIELTPEP